MRTINDGVHLHHINKKFVDNFSRKNVSNPCCMLHKKIIIKKDSIKR